MTGSDIRTLIESFSRLRVLVVGDAMLDSYSEGTADRLCPEAPVPVVQVTGRRDMPGGAANTAINLRAMGAEVALVSVVGADCEGQTLRTLLEGEGVRTDWLFEEKTRRTLAKHRLCAGPQLVARMDQGDVFAPDKEIEEKVRRAISLAPARFDAVVVSDYSYGVMTDEVIRALPDSRVGRPILVVDAKDLRRYTNARPSAVKPNYQQAVTLLGREADADTLRVELVQSEASTILALTGAQIAAVTLDSEGALAIERGREPHRTYAQPAPGKRTSGAGDTFLSLLTLGLAANAPTPTAAELASAAAAIVVSKDETASCTPSELMAYVAGREKRVPDAIVLKTGLDYERRRGRTIVFTNGCFDIMHAGHTTFLNQAKALGDVLVVGVNSDESVRRLKGPSRPINDAADRIAVLSALSCIDYIVEFNEDTPEDLLRAIRPDVFVKGGDYSRELLPEARIVEEYGGRVQILPYVEDRSTTGIIERVRERGELVVS